MLPEFPRAHDAIQKVWHRILFDAAGSSDPLISDVPIRAQREGHRTFFGESEMDYKKESVSHTWEPKIGEGIPTEEFFGLARRMGEEIATNQARRVFAAMSEASLKTGTIEKSEGPLTFDLWLKKMDAFELDFDEKGTPIWPQWFLSEEVVGEFRAALAEPTPEQKERRAELVARKRKEFDERESRRRLVE